MHADLPHGFILHRLRTVSAAVVPGLFDFQAWQHLTAWKPSGVLNMSRSLGWLLEIGFVGMCSAQSRIDCISTPHSFCRNFDFDGNATWRTYQANLEIPTGRDVAATIEKFKAKWYQREIVWRPPRASDSRGSCLYLAVFVLNAY